MLSRLLLVVLVAPAAACLAGYAHDASKCTKAGCCTTAWAGTCSDGAVPAAYPGDQNNHVCARDGWGTPYKWNYKCCAASGGGGGESGDGDLTAKDANSIRKACMKGKKACAARIAWEIWGPGAGGVVVLIIIVVICCKKKKAPAPTAALQTGEQAKEFGAETTKVVQNEAASEAKEVALELVA